MSEYFRCFEELIPRGHRLEHTLEVLGGARQEVVPIPARLPGRLSYAYWRRPHAYLEPAVRAGISAFALMDPDRLADGLNRFARDLELVQVQEVAVPALPLARLSAAATA